MLSFSRKIVIVEFRLTFRRTEKGSPLREEPSQSNFRALCKRDRIVDIHTQIADGILDV